MQDQADSVSEPAGFRQNLEGRISAALLCGLCLIIFLQILGRFGIFPGQVWTEELTRWMWVWMALIGCAAAEAHRQHLRMDILTSFLPHPVRSAMNRMQDLLAALVALYLCWQGCKGVLRTWSNESVTLPVSDAVLYAALPLAMAWWAYRLIRRLRNPLA
jgi:TRAP-type C4-dicarboxylate transport system permease small subunit